MNALVKIIIGTLIVVGIFTAFSAVFPQQLSSNIDGALIYFFSAINNLNGWVHVATIFDIIRVIFAFILGICIYYLLKMFYHLIT